MAKKRKDINEIAFSIVEQATGGEIEKPSKQNPHGGVIRVAASTGDKKKKKPGSKDKKKK